MYISTSKDIQRPEPAPAKATDPVSPSASHLRALFQNTTDAIWLVDEERRFVAFNEFLFDIIKQTMGVEIAVGQHHPGLFPGQEEAFWNEAYDRVMTGERFLIENEYGGRYGRVTVEFSLSPVWDESRIIGIAGIGRDVTRQRTLVHDLEQSEANYRQLFLNSPQPMWVIDVQTRTIAKANRAASKLYGYTQEELEGLDLLDLRPVEEHGLFLRTVNSSFDSGQDHRTITKHIRKDGTVMDVDVQSHAIVFEGRPSRMVLLTDITERLQIERQNHEANERFRLASEAVTSLIWDWHLDENKVYRYGLDRLTGYSVDQDLSPDWWNDRIHRDDQDRIALQLENALRSDPAYEAEYRFLHKDGQYHYVWERGIIVRNAEGRATRVVGSTLDISERKHMELALKHEKSQAIAARRKAEEMNRMKSIFLSNMSHEIRTPLTAILGFAQVLLDSVEDPDAKKAARIIETSGHRLLATINELLDLAALEAGKMKPKVNRCDLAHEVRQCVELLHPLAEQKALSLSLVLERATLPMSTDDQFIHQILNNLIGNAIKFTATGGVSVTLATCEHTSASRSSFASSGESLEYGTRPSAPYAIIDVTDTGIGVSKSFLPNLFEPFKQESDGYQRTFEGVGLGLHITAEMVTSLGGSIEVVSQKGAGATFRVRLPLRTDPEPARTVNAAKRELAPQRFGKILYIEDVADTALLVEAYLAGSANVTVASNPAEAHQALMSDNFDTILMDIHLGGGITGLDLTRALRAEGVNCPIIALTAYAMGEDRANALAAGCTNYLSKPFTRAELMGVLEEALRDANHGDRPSARASHLPRLTQVQAEK